MSERMAEVPDPPEGKGGRSPGGASGPPPGSAPPPIAGRSPTVDSQAAASLAVSFVLGRLQRFALANGRWSGAQIQVPPTGVVHIAGASTSDARAFATYYGDPDSAEVALGVTPLRAIPFPRGLSRLRLELPGHRPLYDLAPEWDWATRDGDKAIEMLMPFRNATVFFGHIHQETHHQTGSQSCQRPDDQLHGARPPAAIMAQVS